MCYESKLNTQMELAERQHQEEVNRLKEQLSKLQIDQEETERALRSQIGEAEKTKRKAINDLKTTERRAELTEKKLESEQAESTRLRGDIEDMKNTLNTSENRLLEALTMAEKLAGLTEENRDLWNIVRPLGEHVVLAEDIGKEWPELPMFPKRFDAYVFNVVKECVQSTLA